MICIFRSEFEIVIPFKLDMKIANKEMRLGVDKKKFSVVIGFSCQRASFLHDARKTKSFSYSGPLDEEYY